MQSSQNKPSRTADPPISVKRYKKKNIYNQILHISATPQSVQMSQKLKVSMESPLLRNLYISVASYLLKKLYAHFLEISPHTVQIRLIL